MGLLCAMYLGGILSPQKDLHEFPIAMVNEEAGGAIPSGDGFEPLGVGEQVANGVEEEIPEGKIDLQPMDLNTAQHRMSRGRIYGAIVIPADFSSAAAHLAVGALTDGPVEKPTITILTNPRAGTFSEAIVQRVADQMSTQINATMGEQVTTMVEEKGQVSTAARALLSQPVDFTVQPYRPLPENSGQGLSAFYYSLLLTLAGFTGASIVHTLVDGQLGVLPIEVGPVFEHRPRTRLTRTRTLYVKWAFAVLMGIVVSGLYVLIGSWLGMPIPNALLMWEFGAFVIAAVAITSMSIMAVFGGLGILINLIVFIIIGLPSSGGTVPFEALRSFFQTIGQVVPLHQIYMGTRAMLYFDGSGPAGLWTSLGWTAIGLAAGLVIGLAGTRLYDRLGFHRAPKTEVSPAG